VSDDNLRPLTEELRGSLEPAVIESGESFVIVTSAIERACRTGQRRIDLLRGDEDYKAHWTPQANTVLHLRGTTGRLLLRLVGAVAVRQALVPWRDGEWLAPSRWPPDPHKSRLQHADGPPTPLQVPVGNCVKIDQQFSEMLSARHLHTEQPALPFAIRRKTPSGADTSSPTASLAPA
jgi:hypothetical protein